MHSHPSLRFLALMAGALVTISSAATASPITVSQTADHDADIMLQSYSAGGQTYNSFITVNNANLLFSNPTNLPEHSPGTGTFSVDRASRASGVGPIENPSNVDIAANQGNLNLNNIIDVEEYGQFAAKLMFSKSVKAGTATPAGVGQILVFERGENSDVMIQGLDANGNLIGNAQRLIRTGHAGTTQVDTGVHIHTSESSAQLDGLWQVSLSDLGLGEAWGVQLSVPQGATDFNGPDFKVVGVDMTGTGDPPHSAPEPSSGLLAALAAAAFGAIRLRRRSA